MFFHNFIPNKKTKFNYTDPPWMAKIVKSKLREHSNLVKQNYKNGKKYWLFLNCDSLHASHYKAWSYKKKKHKKIKAYRKSIVNRCLLTLDLKPLRS